MSYRKCEWCGEYLRKYVSKCPSCGEKNANDTALDDSIVDLMTKNELILRIRNLADNNHIKDDLIKMTKSELLTLYRESKKTKKRYE